MKQRFLLLLAAMLLSLGLAKAQSTLVATFKATPVTGYETYCGNATFEEYDDKVVIKGWDGIEGDDLTLLWDNNGWTTINGEATPWLYYSEKSGLNLYGVYAYANYISGTWNATEGGSFYIGVYVYNSSSDNNPLWTYFYWNLTPTVTGIDAVASDSAAASSKICQDGQLIIQSNGKNYSVLGQEIK